MNSEKRLISNLPGVDTPPSRSTPMTATNNPITPVTTMNLLAAMRRTKTVRLTKYISRLVAKYRRAPEHERQIGSQARYQVPCNLRSRHLVIHGEPGSHLGRLAQVAHRSDHDWHEPVGNEARTEQHDMIHLDHAVAHAVPANAVGD